MIQKIHVVRERSARRLPPTAAALLCFGCLAIAPLGAQELAASAERGDIVQGGLGPGGVGVPDGQSELRLWLTGETGTFADSDGTVAAAPGGAVRSWNERSGTGFRLTQSSLSSAPTLKAAAANGLSALDFNGDQSLATGILGSELFSTDQTTIFFAKKPRQPLICMEWSSGSRVLFETRPEDGMARFDFGPQPPGGISGALNTIGAYHIISGSKKPIASINHFLRVDGVIDGQRANDNILNNEVTRTFNLGDNDWSGEIAEIIIYRQALNDAQQTIVENYLSAKYSIPLRTDDGANDIYAGDDPANGDFDLDVAGVGLEADGSHPLAHSAGLVVEDAGFLLDNGDYLAFGHGSLAPPQDTASDLPPWALTRWSRAWYLDVSNEGPAAPGLQGVDISFDWAEAGREGTPDPGLKYVLLQRIGDVSEFGAAQTSAVVEGGRVTFPGVNALGLAPGQYTIGAFLGDGPATDPSPLNGEQQIRLNQVLSWSYEGSATSFDVYFGQDAAAVQNAGNASPEFMGNQAAMAFSPGTLAGSSTYFWRVDAIGSSTVKGATWGFSTRPEAPVANFASNVTQGEPPLAVQFFDASQNIVDSWEWDFDGDGTPDSFDQAPAPFVYAEPGRYTVSLTVSGPGGSDTETKADFINASGASFSAAPTEGVGSLLVQFTDTSTNSPTEWEWDFENDGTPDSAAQNPTHFYDSPGVYNVRLTASGETILAQNFITVRVPAAADFSADPASGPRPLLVTFTDSSVGEIDTWEWDFDGDGSADLVDHAGGPVQHEYVQPGLYSVGLTVSGLSGTSQVVKTDLVESIDGPNRAPELCVAEQQIFLSSLGERVELDASCSTDADRDPIFFSWRESPDNPRRGLIPPDSGSLPRLSLFLPEPGRYAFEVRASDGQDASAETAEIEVYAPGLSGVVGVSPSDGLVRLPDARVSAYATAQDAASGANPVDAAVADSLGSYQLRHLSPESATQSRTYFLGLRREGFVEPAVQQVVVRPDPGPSDAAKNFSMSRGGAAPLAGVVRDSAGAPVQNALVAIVPGLGAASFIDSTDSSGAYSLSGVPQGSWALQLRGPAGGGFQPEVRDVSVGASPAPLDLTLSPAAGSGSLSGRVLLSGANEPLAGVSLSLGASAQTATGADGTYSFASLPSGVYVLTLSKTGYETRRETTVSVPPGGAERDFFLNFDGQGPTIRGTVTDLDTGRIVPYAQVSLLDAEGLPLRADVADLAGYYQIDDVPAGTRRLRCEMPGYRPETALVSVTASFEQDFQLDAFVNQAASRGARGQGGEPPVAAVAQERILLPNALSGATLDATPSQGENLVYSWRESPFNPASGLLPSNAEALGLIEIGGFPRPGIYRFNVQVASGGLLSGNIASIEVFAPGLAGNVHLSPSDGALGLAQVVLRAYPEANHAEAAAFSDTGFADSKETLDNPIGDFFFDSLGVGDYWIVARANDPDLGFRQYGPAKRSVNYDARAGEMAVNMAKATFSLEGDITDSATGLPLENVRVAMTPGVLAETFRGSTDANGRFRLAAVPQGSGWPVMLFKEGYETTLFFADISGDAREDRSMSPSVPGQSARLSGRVEASHGGVALPVANAEVILGSGFAKATTDADGFYEFPQLPPGSYFGVVRKDGYRVEQLGSFGFLDIFPGDNEFGVELDFEGRGPALALVALDESGAPVEGVEVSLLAGAPARTEGAVEAARNSPRGAPVSTDTAGRAALNGVPHGGRALFVRWPSGEEFVAFVRVDGDGELLLFRPDLLSFDGGWKVY